MHVDNSFWKEGEKEENRVENKTAEVKRIEIESCENIKINLV